MLTTGQANYKKGHEFTIVTNYGLSCAAGELPTTKLFVVTMRIHNPRSTIHNSRFKNDDVLCNEKRMNVLVPDGHLLFFLVNKVSKKPRSKQWGLPALPAVKKC